MIFNEDSRVKIPALVHLTRLGYTYIPKYLAKDYHPETNIFTELFQESISLINGKLFSRKETDLLIAELNVRLDNKDLGKVFHNSLLGDFPVKLIDFDNFSNNSFHIVTELTCKNGEEEFRPDITVLINGMPLALIEVKKPNNHDGILAERERINKRFRNHAFNKFKNITQLLIFSNNQDYDDENINPVQGAFYAAPDHENVKFNRFREEDTRINQRILPLNFDEEKMILSDNNLVSIHGTPEYETNKDPLSPTNRLLTSLLSKERFKVILKYSIVYLQITDKVSSRLEKHIMRYPQLFATLSIETKLNKGIKKGIIWHTQGSGKTALAYYNVFYLRDYYQKLNIIAKFYFIVDRLDLATQAHDEFVARGLTVEMVSSKDDFIKNIKTSGASSLNTGLQTITVVNIQKFSAESVSASSDYNINIQRIYFMDEVHRSYNPKGSFLANLVNSDRNAVIIGLTGTPLITGEFKSKQIFGDYIHKYYYNKSISDGYTLKLLREGIETKFRTEINQVYNEIVKEGEFKKSEVFAHEKFAEPLTEYIINDFKKGRILNDDQSTGAMIVCDSSAQARMIYSMIVRYNEKIRRKDHETIEPLSNYNLAAEPGAAFRRPMEQPVSCALILYDENTKEIREDYQSDFKEGKIDFLIVYNMLLTGFNAPRLKKLYLLRKIDRHNLLQTLTRVNRPYKKYRYGYVVDFADIRKEFDRTNQDYFRELQEELGDETQNYSNLFKSHDEITLEIEAIKEKLFLYDFSNLEEFQKIISRISDKDEILSLKKALEGLKSLYNIIILMGYGDLTEKFEFDKVNKLLSEVSNRIDIINLKDSLDTSADNTSLLNMALEKMQFTFRKITEHELQIADKFREALEKARQELERSGDIHDPRFISLFEELKRVFKKKNVEELTAEEMNETIRDLNSIRDRASDLNTRDSLLAARYRNDYKFARIHKRINERNMNVLNTDSALLEALLSIKQHTDETVLNNEALLSNQEFFAEAAKRTIMETLEERGIRNLEAVKFFNSLLVEEYTSERKG